jgi:CheY-like chemotaxis protein
MTELLRRTLGEQIAISLELADNLWPVFADASQVESALINLAINARDAMPGGGRLIIETMNSQLDEYYAAGKAEVEPGDYAMLAVSDSGTGIPADILDRVFEPFMTTKEMGKGSGLGLSMIYGFAKQSGGHVSIYSEEGVGTTVCLYLPKSGEAVAGNGVKDDTGQHVELEGLRVLVVEDNVNVRAVAVGQLTSFGCRVLEAGDAATALGIVAGSEDIDLLFTDLVLPTGMSGLDLVEEARNQRPHLQYLLTSGFADTVLTNGANVDAGRRLLVKPYRRAELAAKIKEVLQDI